MARFSTGLRNALASNYGLGLMMNGGTIHVYGGSRPSTPDDPPGTSQLGQITTDGLVFVPGNDTIGAGLILTLVSPGILTKTGTWRLKGSLPGLATWWRWCWADADPLTQSIYYPRVDGLIGSELILVDNSIYSGLNVEIEQFLFTLSLGM